MPLPPVLYLSVCLLAFLSAGCSGRSSGTQPPSSVLTARNAHVDALPDSACTAANLDTPSQSAQELQERGTTFHQAGTRDSAYAYYADALQLQSPSKAADLCRMLNRSPLLRLRRTLEEQNAFVQDVRNVIRATPAGERGARQITSPEEAMAVLEAMLSHRKANIEVRASRPGMRVEYRRWLSRNDTTVLWESVYSNTIIRRPAMAYRFKFRMPGAVQDTIIDLPCANNCRVPLP
jgi:hypothetical protein